MDSSRESMNGFPVCLIRLGMRFSPGAARLQIGLTWLTYSSCVAAAKAVDASTTTSATPSTVPTPPLAMSARYPAGLGDGKVRSVLRRQLANLLRGRPGEQGAGGIVALAHHRVRGHHRVPPDRDAAQ